MSVLVTDAQKEEVGTFWGNRVKAVVSRALEESDPSSETLKYLFSESEAGELDPLVGDKVLELIQRHRPYGTPEVFSDRCYPAGYAYLSVEHQIDILRTYWPQLNVDAAMKLLRDNHFHTEFPQWVEGLFAVIRPGYFSDHYGEEVEEIFKKISATRRFFNGREGQLETDRIRQDPRTEKMLNAVYAVQKTDILIIPAQFGLHHRGRCTPRVRDLYSVNPSEYGLGVVSVCCMLLTHPDRLQTENDLFLECAGDDYAPCCDGHYDAVSDLAFNEGVVEYHTLFPATTSPAYGCVTAYLPQL